MKTYTKSDFHNPEQLTRQQVGDEYRLLLPEELGGQWYALNSPSEYFSTTKDEFIDTTWLQKSWFGSDLSKLTYRVPIATPLPDGTVLSSNEYCFSDAPAKPRLYLAGGMTGYVDYNFPAFFKASAELEKQGYEVLNPAQMDLDSGWTLEELKELDVGQFQEFLKGAVKRDLDAIQTCQAIAMLPGWENSKGAKAELSVAQWLGLDVIYLKGDAPTEPPQPYNSDERAEWETSRFAASAPLGAFTSASTVGMSLPPKSYAPDDPKGAAGAKKAPMWLLPASAMRETAWVHKHGADKYGPFNWRESSVCSSTYISAIMRHLDLWRDGEDNDAESGRSHLASIAASCNILMDAMQCGTLRDDRNKLK